MMNEGVPGGWIFVAIYLVVVLVCTVLEWRYRGWISALSKALVSLTIPGSGSCAVQDRTKKMRI